MKQKNCEKIKKLLLNRENDIDMIEELKGSIKEYRENIKQADKSIRVLTE